MNPTIANAIITAFAELLRVVPQLVVDVQNILDKAEPTAADWDALKARVQEKSYWDYVTSSDLPKPEPPPSDSAPG